MTIYTINEQGTQEVKNFLALHGKDDLNFVPFLIMAESSADIDFNLGFQASIEIGARYSNDGKPHVLLLQREWFTSEPEFD